MTLSRIRLGKHEEVCSHCAGTGKVTRAGIYPEHERALDLLPDFGDGVTTSHVADALACGYGAAWNRLARLVAAGLASQSKKRGRVLWKRTKPVSPNAEEIAT